MTNILTNLELHNQALEIAACYLKSERELIEILRETDKRQSYFEHKYKSLFEYATGALKLSNDVAYYFIKVARISVRVPELKKALDEKKITVSQARRIAPVITQENANDLITKSQILSQKEIEKEVAKINPKLGVKDSLKFVSETIIELKVGITEKTMEKLKRVKELECQRQQKSCNFEKAIDQALEVYLQKHDPIKKTERFESRRKSKTETLKNEDSKNESSKSEYPESEASDGEFSRSEKIKASLSDQNLTQAKNVRRKPIPALIKHPVILRDNAQCIYVNPNNIRCLEKKWLHLHHKHQVSKGGTHRIENLSTLCFGHHKLTHLHQSLEH